MSEYRIASRYAKSLLDLAVEKKVLEEVNKDMQLLTGIAEESRDLVLMLKSPIISHDKKLSVLDKVFKGKVNDMTMSFFTILTKKHREAYLIPVAEEFHHQYNVFKGIEEATITTTFPLNDALRKEFINLVERISSKKVELTEKIDESLIGGFILKIGDRQIDDSINSKLKALRLEFTKTTTKRPIKVIR
ncbi:ATP synthase F1 subunit delta [Roseivirga spongicola]|uniref:ATP synthase subunit delta n=1 Tax=Roseivirga spongicola TaxID=333140 RepID=A0A150XHA8_9BACT|nr:ATP synthase F1 subunit delta [Roseivirga spongicola]KYG78102.1 ATP synthase F1 subunit delta [Roseivirga spongicola]